MKTTVPCVSAVAILFFVVKPVIPFSTSCMFKRGTEKCTFRIKSSRTRSSGEIASMAAQGSGSPSDRADIPAWFEPWDRRERWLLTVRKKRHQTAFRLPLGFAVKNATELAAGLWATDRPIPRSQIEFLASGAHAPRRRPLPKHSLLRRCDPSGRVAARVGAALRRGGRAGRAA